MIHHRQLILPLAALFFLAAGCSSSSSRSGQLILTPIESQKKFSQKFTESYATQNDDGSFEFVLIADDADRPESRQRPKAAGQPLEPTDLSPLRQLVHVKIPWLPERGNISETIVSNAAVDWYILSDVPERQQDLIQYSGAGFALAYPSDKTIDLNLKSAKLKPQVVRGGLTDPLGRFGLSGDIRAAKNPAKLRELLGGVRTRVATLR